MCVCVRICEVGGWGGGFVYGRAFWGLGAWRVLRAGRCVVKLVEFRVPRSTGVWSSRYRCLVLDSV